jgi:hypothetical protein
VRNGWVLGNMQKLEKVITEVNCRWWDLKIVYVTFLLNI